MDDRDPRLSPVQVTVNGTTGVLLVHLMHELKTEDGGGVLSRALSLMDMALRKQREGYRLCLIDPRTGHQSDVSI